MLIFSLTTIPERLELGLTHRCITSLVSQTMAADLILVNIPEKTRSNHAYNHERALDLEKISDTVKVNWGITDYGPITKLVGALDYGSRDALLVLVDDDVTLAADAVATLYGALGQRSAVGFHSRDADIDKGSGQVIDLPWRHGVDGGQREGQLVPTVFLETSGIAMYKQSIFLPSPKFKQWLASFDEATFRSADDILIGAWLHEKGVTPYRLASNAYFSTHDPKGTRQLLTINVVNGNNNIAFQKMLDQGYFSGLVSGTIERFEGDHQYHSYRERAGAWLVRLRLRFVLLTLFLLFVAFFYVMLKNAKRLF